MSENLKSHKQKLKERISLWKKISKFFTFFSVVILTVLYFWLQRTDNDEKAFTVFNFATEDVRWWQVENALPLPSEKFPQSESLLRVEKAPTFEDQIAWRITSPTDSPADYNEADANVRNLRSLIAIRNIGALKNANAQTRALYTNKSAPRVSFGISLPDGSMEIHVIVVGMHLPEIDAYEIVIDEMVYFVPSPFILALMKTKGMLAEKNFLNIEPRVISWIASYHQIKLMNYIIFRNNLKYLASPLYSDEKVLKYIENLSNSTFQKSNKVQFDSKKLEKVIQSIGFLTSSQEVTSTEERKQVLQNVNLQTSFHVRTDSRVLRREIVLCIFQHDGLAYAIASTLFNKSILSINTKKAFTVPPPTSTFKTRVKGVENYCSKPHKNLANITLYRIENANLSSLASTLSSLSM